MITAQRLTFEQYLEQSDETEQRYELVDGVLIEMPPESEPSTSIANYLFLQLVNAGLSFRLVQPHACEIQVPVLQAGDAANRFPDLVVMREEHLELTRRRLTITFDMLPPHLVVEVISPGKQNRERDYGRKQRQYASRGIPEYWLIATEEKSVTVLQLDDGKYIEFNRFRNDAQIQSLELEQLDVRLSLTVEQMLEAVNMTSK